VGNEGGFAPTTVTTYRIDPGTGSLSTVDVAVAGARVWGVAADPGGQFVYASVVQYDPADPPPGLSVFSVNPSNGGLMLLGTLTTPGNPAAVVADPVAHFVYATLPDAAEVQMFAVDAAGTLHDLGRVSTGSTPKAAAIDPAGHYLYVANYGSNDVSIYAIDAATGRLTAAGTVAAGLTPSSVTIDPAGRFAYVGNYAVGQISIFSIDAATGALTPAGSAGT
jgi:YVTN family beta-propeller protein